MTCRIKSANRSSENGMAVGVLAGASSSVVSRRRATRCARLTRIKAKPTSSRRKTGLREVVRARPARRLNSMTWGRCGGGGQ